MTSIKSKPISILVAALVAILLAVSTEAQQHRATRLGNPATRFAKRRIQKTEDVRVLLRGGRTKADVDAILAGAGWKGNLEDFDRAAASADIARIEIPAGTRLPFMASRERGPGHKPHVLMDVLWAGKEPIDAWAFELVSRCTRYRVVVPLACGNFWVEDLGGACAPPVVNVNTPDDVCVTQPIEIAVDVKNPPADGKVVVTFNGREVASGYLSDGFYSAGIPGVARPGAYEVNVTAGDVTSSSTVHVKACVPVCATTAWPNPAKAGRPIGVDVLGSNVAPGVQGGIKSAMIEIVRDGVVVDTVEITAPDLSRDDIIIKKSGAYTLRAFVVDEAGQTSINACETTIDVKGGLPIFAGAYFGKERMTHDSGPGSPGGRCAPLVGAEVGIQHRIGARAEVEMALGGKLNARDGENSSLFADVAFSCLMKGCFIGGGVSAWDLTRDNGSRLLALLVQGGVDLTHDGRWRFVAQARAPFARFDDLDDNYQLWGGLRFRTFHSN
ncbi:MAG: hypothetical protein JXO72_02610 [Vicinamibacteria bacterium]|nr:hypothetical protein [Vicinamibacteria bacterium]